MTQSPQHLVKPGFRRCIGAISESERHLLETHGGVKLQHSVYVREVHDRVKKTLEPASLRRSFRFLYSLQWRRGEPCDPVAAAPGFGFRVQGFKYSVEEFSFKV